MQTHRFLERNECKDSDNVAEGKVSKRRRWWLGGGWRESSDSFDPIMYENFPFQFKLSRALFVILSRISGNCTAPPRGPVTHSPLFSATFTRFPINLSLRPLRIQHQPCSHAQPRMPDLGRHVPPRCAASHKRHSTVHSNSQHEPRFGDIYRKRPTPVGTES